MKKVLLFLILLSMSDAYGQNEFASSSFYNDFKKIYADAQLGFATYKGAPQKSGFEELAAEYKVKLLLPLADSGKIVVPVTGNPYVVYYFEPDKVRLKVDQRAVNLRDAVLTAFGQPLYARTETSLVNNYPFSNAYYFTNPNETRSSLATFRMSLYYNMDKYYLSFEIRGKRS